jgi:hypothetical protein
MNRASFYQQRNAGLWRVARVAHRCDWKHNGFRCGHHINPGDRYFDTRELNPNSSNIHGTYRICAECAIEEI